MPTSYTGLAHQPKHLQKNTHFYLQDLDIHALCLEHYGMELVAIKLLSGELDGNYLVEDAHAHKKLLKICRLASDSPDDASIRVFSFIHQHHPNLPIQRLILAKNNAEYITIEHQGVAYVVYLLSFIEGDVLSSSPQQTLSFYADLGERVAQLDQVLARYPRSLPAEPLIWDLQHIQALRSFFEHVPDDLQPIISDILKAHQVQILPIEHELPKQMIHNDFNPHNLIVDSQTHRVAGILDFGDMVYSHRVNNLAIACSYFFTDDSDPLLYVRHIVRAYQRIYPLTLAEQSIFLLSVAVRLAMTVLITHRRVHINPENASYIFRNLPVTLIGLRFFQAHGVDDLSTCTHSLFDVE